MAFGTLVCIMEGIVICGSFEVAKYILIVIVEMMYAMYIDIAIANIFAVL